MELTETTRDKYLQLLKQHPLIHDDRLVLSANKNKNGKKFPLHPEWRISPILQKDGEITGYLKNDVFHGKSYKGPYDVIVMGYELNHKYLNYKSNKYTEFLNGIRLEIKHNSVKITLNNVLNLKPKKSRKKIVVDAIKALVYFGVIKSKCCDDRSLTSRCYRILKDYFNNTEYEIRIDSMDRMLYQKALHLYVRNNYSCVALTTPGLSNRKKQGYYIKVYDKDKDKEKEKVEEGDAEYPIRIEITLYSKYLKNFDYSGSAFKIIQTMIVVIEKLLYQTFRRKKLLRDLYQFIQCEDIYLFLSNKRSYFQNISLDLTPLLSSGRNQYTRDII